MRAAGLARIAALGDGACPASEEFPMIERIDAGPRMSEGVAYNGILWVAGVI